MRRHVILRGSKTTWMWLHCTVHGFITFILFSLYVFSRQCAYSLVQLACYALNIQYFPPKWKRDGLTSSVSDILVRIQMRKFWNKLTVLICRVSKEFIYLEANTIFNNKTVAKWKTVKPTSAPTENFGSNLYSFKGTQAWEFFGLWFRNFCFFVVSYA